MAVTYLTFPLSHIPDDHAFGYGHVPAKYMIVIPEASLTPNGLNPTSMTQMGRLRQIIQTHLRQCYVTPLVKARRSLKAKTLYAKDMSLYLPLLYQEIDLVRPERILVMGKFAAKKLIPKFVSMKEDHGTLFTVTGSELDPSLSHLDPMVIVPTFSLNDLVKNLMARPYFSNDLSRFAYLEVDHPEWEVYERMADIPIPDSEDITIDVETGGLDLENEMHMIGVAYRNQNFIVHYPEPDDIAQFMTNVNDSTSKIVFHNATFDLAHMIRSSNGKAPLPKRRIGDVMIRSHISGIQDKSLKHLTSLHTKLPGPHSGGRFHDEQYLAEDIRSTLALKDVPILNTAKGTYADALYHDLAVTLVQMRLRGVYIDRNKLLEILVLSEQELAQDSGILSDYQTNGNINWNSTQQVSDLMLELGIPLSTTTASGQYSVAEGTIIELMNDPNLDYDQYAFLQTMMKYRGSSKLVSGFLKSYLEHLDENWLVYPNLKLLGTETGRLSCSSPNLQQIPRQGDFKLVFKPRWVDPRYAFDGMTGPGYYGLVDFAGAELRMAAIISGDKQMAEFILSGDPHSFMAKLAFPDKIPSDATIKEVKNHFAYYRKASKSTTFASLYGGSISGIAKSNNLREEDVATVDAALRREAPSLMTWLDQIKAKCVRTLKVETIFGNQRGLEEKWLYEGKGGVERAGCNMPIQGSSGILALIVLRKLHQLCVEHNLMSRPIFGVHDSILSEIAEHELDTYMKIVQEAYLDIENSPIVDYPVYQMLPVEGDLEVGRTWANTETTNETNVNILYSIPCSSAGIPVIEGELQ